MRPFIGTRARLRALRTGKPRLWASIPPQKILCLFQDPLAVAVFCHYLHAFGGGKPSISFVLFGDLNAWIFCLGEIEDDYLKERLACPFVIETLMGAEVVEDAELGGCKPCFLTRLAKRRFEAFFFVLYLPLWEIPIVAAMIKDEKLDALTRTAIDDDPCRNDLFRPCGTSPIRFARHKRLFVELATRSGRGTTPGRYRLCRPFFSFLSIPRIVSRGHALIISRRVAQPRLA